MSKKKYYLVYAVITIFPLLPIIIGLFDSRLGFHNDWWVNYWIIEYYKEYFTINNSMPEVIHTWSDGRGIGRPDPVFYGFLFYPFMALISNLIGTNLTMMSQF